jgi:hypothetical protein
MRSGKPAGEMRIAAALFERRSLKHENARSILVRRDCGTQGRIAGPDDEHVGFPVREFGGTHGYLCNAATRGRGHT